MAAEGGDPSPEAVLAYFNCGGAVDLTLPLSVSWELVLDTTRPDLTSGEVPARLPAQSVLMFRSTPKAGRAEGESP